MPERDLVPPAERPGHHPVDFIETSSDTIWFNPFDYPVAVQVHVGAEGKRGPTQAEDDRWKSLPPPVRREKQTGIRTYVIAPKSERVIPSDFDMAIQHTQCSHYDCLGSKGLYCRNPDHAEYKQIVGGLYPRLINRGTQRTPISSPPKLHWALDDNRAKAEAALAAAKQKLAEAANSRDAFLIAQADLAEAHKQIAEAEARVATADANANHKAIAEAGGATPPAASPPTNNSPAQPATGKKDK